MARKKVASDPIEQKLDLLVGLAQDAFVLQAGVNSHEVAAIIGIDKGAYPISPSVPRLGSNAP